MWFQGGAVLALQRDDADVIEYRVSGFPSNEGAFIAKFYDAWQTLWYQGDFQGEWTGSYVTADDALAALQSDLNRRQNQNPPGAR